MHYFFLRGKKSMTTFALSTIINQPLDIVIKALLNADNFPFWTTDLVKFEIVKGKPGEVGSIGHLHYSQKGRSYIMEDELIFCEPGRKYISMVSGDFLSATVETSLDSSGAETKMNIVWSGRGEKLILKILLPVIRSKLMKQSKSELEKFKR
jgi:hypothetical protein